MPTVRNKITTGIGLRLVRVAERDDDGCIKVPTSGDWMPATNDVAFEGIRAEGALRLTLNIPEPRRISARGDDRAYYTFQLPPDELPTGELAVSKTHFDVITMVTSTQEFGSDPIRKVGLATDQQGEEPACFMRGSREAVDTQDGSAYFGVQVWQTYLVLNALLATRPIPFEDGSIGEFIFPLAANDASVDEMGTTFTTAVHGFTKAPYLMVITQGKFGLDAFLGDGVDTAYTLSNTTLRSGAPVVVSVEGAVQHSGWSEANGVITFVVAPAAANKIMVEYEYTD